MHSQIHTYTHIDTQICICITTCTGFPGGSDGKESTSNARDLGSIPGLGRSPGGGHGNPLQYSCLENPHGQRSLVGYSPWGCKESDMTKHTHNYIYTHAYMYTHIPTYTHTPSRFRSLPPWLHPAQFCLHGHPLSRSAIVTSLVVQCLGLYAVNAGGVGSIPGQGTKILHAMQCGKKKKKKKKTQLLLAHSS